VQELLKANPFQTIQRIKHALENTVSLSSIRRIIRQAGLSYQKTSWRTQPRDMRLELDDFFNQFDKVVNSGRELISIDETGFITTQLPIRGYGIRGKRLRVAKRHVKRCKTTSIVAISQYGLVAIDTFNGNANGLLFERFIREAFRMAPNSVAVLDNIAFHRSNVVRRIADEYGVELLFTPAYSPECNPVENFFSAAKASVRKATLQHETINDPEVFTALVDETVNNLAEHHYFGGYFAPRTRETARPSLMFP
jgi:transposase